MALKFERAQQHQRDEIDRLMVRAFTPYVQKLKSIPKAGPYPDLGAAIERGEYYVAIDGADIVGVIEIKLIGDEVKIDQVSVDPSRQGDGIGGWIISQAEELAKRLGANAMTMFTAEIISDLLRFYSRHGFVETERGPPPHGKDKNVRVFFRKDL